MLLLACAIALGVVVALVIVLVPGSGPSSQSSACSLLTGTEASALLGYPAASQYVPAGHLEAGMSFCSFGSTAGEMRELQHTPQSFEQSYKSLQVTIRDAPTDFAGAALRKIATPVAVGGLTAWWSSLQPGGAEPASPSAHELAAVKDEREVVIQLTTTGQAERTDERAMAEILQQI